MTIVWFSRHRPTRRQRQRLRELFGPELRLKRDKQPFDGADDVVARFRRSGADEMVVVAPLSVTRQILALGVRPILVEMRVCDAKHPQAEVVTNGRHYRFIRFYRLNRITLDTEELQPRLGGRDGKQANQEAKRR